MKSVITMFCLITQVTIALGAPPATTQPSRGSGQGATAVFQPNYEPIVFKLEHANCFEVARTLAGAFSACSSIPVEQSNGVVFVGPPESQAMARKLVGEMDSVVTQPDGPHIVVFPVQHRRVDELVEHLIRVTEGRRLRISGDRSRSKVLLRGDAQEIKNAERLLKELDTPAAGVSIEFAFLQAKSGDAAAGRPMPADLAEVAKELERFGQLTLLGRLSTVAVEGEKFSVEGQVVPGITAEVRGFVSGANQEGTVKADVKASLRLLPAQVAESKDRPPVAYFNLETVVTTQRGDYLVLGSAPAGSQIGESAILVMHVRK
jgi:hypothetical protein